MKTNSIVPYKKAIQLLTFFLIFITSSFIALVLKSNLFVYNFIVLMPSVIYLLYLNRNVDRKLIPEGIILGFFAEILFDIFAHQSKAWFSPSIFLFRPLNLPIENFIWNIFYILLVFGFYEYFFDSYKSKKLPASHRVWILIVCLITLLIPLIYILNPSLFIFPYFYLIAVVIMVIVDYILLKKYPKFATKAVIASLVLLPLAFVHEFVSLELKHWIFEKGYHIGYLVIANYSIPFEELIFYISAPITLICIYEILVDNKKG